MTEYQHVYTNRGRLSYIPDHLHDSERICRRIFQGRNRRPHRIHIAHVAPDPTLFHRQRQPSSKSYIIEKLAGPRENAKRYLRSFIDTHFANSSQTPPVISPRSPTSSARTSTVSPSGSRRWSWATSEMRTSPRSSVGGSLAAPRPSISDGHRSSGRSAKSTASSVVRQVPEEKPLASGNGINVTIALTEPVLYLQGFDQNESSERSTAMLRGSLHLKVTKPAKIKAITLKFRGKAITKWPEGKISIHVTLGVLT